MSNRKNDILSNLRKVIGEVYEMDMNEVNMNLTFLEMGLDSISIIQVRQLVKNQYKLEVSVNRLFDDIATLDNLADFIDSALPPEETKEIPVVEEKTVLPLSNSNMQHFSGADQLPVNMDLQGIIRAQLQIMTKQIEIMSRLNVNA